MKSILILLLLAAPSHANQFIGLIASAAAATAPASPTPGPNPPPSNRCTNCDGKGRLGDGTVSVDCPECEDGIVTTAVKLTVPCDAQAGQIAKARINPAIIAAAKPKPIQVPYNGEVSKDGFWRWNQKAYKWLPAKRWVEPVYRTYREFSCPATGGCGWRNVRRMVSPGHWQDIPDLEAFPPLPPAKPMRQSKTSLPSWPEYPSRPLGTRWTYNGGNITASHLGNPHDHHGHEHFDPNWLRTLNQAQLNALGSDSHNGHDKYREHFIVRTR